MGCLKRVDGWRGSVECALVWDRKKAIGMRNLVTHDYGQVDPAILWRTVTRDLPALLKQLDAIGLPEA